MNRLFFEYSRSYDPVAPVIDIEIDGYQPSLNRVAQTALVDSGADATMIPSNILRQIGADFLETRRIRGVTGISQRVRIYVVAIHIGSQIIHGIRAIEMPSGEETILGRGVLNQLKITLDGLGSETTVEIYTD